MPMMRGCQHRPALFLNGRRLQAPANTAIVLRAIRRALSDSEHADGADS
jgi:hypothetical protein